jgi:hypothetical protein
MKTVECGICGKLVKEKGIQYYTKEDIPHREHLLVESQENLECLPGYRHDDILLSPGGVDEHGMVACCKDCLRDLNNDRLPQFSIANEFQIGKTPPELMDLTLSEKLLISKCRPKMYVVKLRSSGGPHQTGLKGNTITFPQDVVKVAQSLPANTDVLADHLRVVFIGKGRPTREMLKKIFTVRKEKVRHALTFLMENNPVYADVTWSRTDDNRSVLDLLPNDDVPNEILQTLELNEDPDNEDENAHSTYTPQTDLDDIPDDTVLMNSVGMVDLECSTVSANDQLNSGAHLAFFEGKGYDVEKGQIYGHFL